jgi:prevent-host-death family protein
MDSFPVTKLNRAAGEVLDAAYRRPVELTERGKRKYVLMAADHYDRVVGAQSQLAYTIENAPQDIHDELMKALDADER